MPILRLTACAGPAAANSQLSQRRVRYRQLVAQHRGMVHAYTELGKAGADTAAKRASVYGNTYGHTIIEVSDAGGGRIGQLIRLFHLPRSPIEITTGDPNGG